MKLLVFAHRAEAQAFLSKLSLKKDETLRLDYYQSDEHNISLLICAEGVEDSLKNLTYILTILEHRQKLPSQIINMGVAGSLNSSLQLSTIYSVRTSYRFLGAKPVFKSHTSIDSKASIDCLSTNDRIISALDSQKLQVHADIVDRELWGISQACRFFKVPFISYKLISDYAGQTDCELIAEKGANYSFELFHYFIENHQGIDPLVSIQTSTQAKLGDKGNTFINDLSPTFSQRVQLEKLLIACQTRGLNLTELLNITKNEKYIDWPRKKRNQFVIKQLTQIADPVQAKLNALCSHLSTSSCKAIAHTENPTVEIKTRISSQKELDEFIKEIKGFPINKLQEFYQGKLDV